MWLTAINSLGHDLLQHWKTQIIIPTVSETNHKIITTSEKNFQKLILRIVPYYSCCA